MGLRAGWQRVAVEANAGHIAESVGAIARLTAPTDTVATDVNLTAYLYADRIGVPTSMLTVAGVPPAEVGRRSARGVHRDRCGRFIHAGGSRRVGARALRACRVGRRHHARHARRRAPAERRSGRARGSGDSVPPSVVPLTPSDMTGARKRLQGSFAARRGHRDALRARPRVQRAGHHCVDPRPGARGAAAQAGHLRERLLDR